MARLFQEMKLDFDRKKQIADYSPPRFSLLMRENSDRKIVGLYFIGHFMTNIKHWSLLLWKILNKKNTRIILKEYT